MSQRIVVDPVTRIEGHLRIEAQMDGDQIAGLWTGRIQVTAPGDYTFTTRSDDGSVTIRAREIDSAEDQEQERCEGSIKVTRIASWR